MMLAKNQHSFSKHIYHCCRAPTRHTRQFVLDAMHYRYRGYTLSGGGSAGLYLALIIRPQRTYFHTFSISAQLTAARMSSGGDPLKQSYIV